MSLKSEIQKTILGNDVEKLAAKLGLAASTLYRWGNPNEESWPPVSRLLPLMKAAADYRILRWLSRQAGLALVKLPSRGLKPGPKTVAAVQAETHRLVAALIEHSDGEKTDAECLEVIDEMIEQLVVMKKQIERGGELPLQEGQRSLKL